MNKIRVLVKHNRNWGRDEDRVRKVALKILKEYNLADRVELSIVFVGRKRAKDLNVKYRNMDYIPQVLSFPMKKEIDRDGWLRLGDVVICNSKMKNEELEEWLRHGIGNLI